MAAGMLVWGLCMPGNAADLVRVAYDDAGVNGAQSHLKNSDGDWRCGNPGTSEEALRTVAFGTRIEFGYRGLNPQAAYQAKLRFFSDGQREVRVKAGTRTLLNSVIIEVGKPVEREMDLPPAAFATGTLALVIEHISGFNGGVVSDVEILSTDPKPLEAIPVPALVIPRLSPQPVKVAGVSDVFVDLGGVWRFHPAPPVNFWQSDVRGLEHESGWAPIQVPGEWAMQGFEVKPGTAAGYRRAFKVPRDWSGKRVKLRCEGVYSDATVWINGKKAGEHQGGFTPFELDVTDLVQAKGENRIALAVINESKADTLASGTKYACHPLGGIPRAIRLVALPAAHVSSLQITTAFDAAFRDATLGVSVEFANEGPIALADVQVSLSLTAPDGQVVPLSPDRIPLGNLVAGGQSTKAVRIPVTSPLKWDNEHPLLYALCVQLEIGGKTLETLVQKVGFRQVEVRGDRLFVNNLPVKLRGINRHEVYPVTGRSVPAGLHRRDVELFREANVNLLRTCHYPPDEALMEAADELGMFIECEAPFCWAPGNGNKNLVLLQSAEMVLTYRNHPAVLFWSLANESKWGEDFIDSSKLVRELDPTRPQTFNNPGDQKFTEIVNRHYPGRGGPAEGRNNAKNPIYLGEDCHLNAYNRLELATDPAIRDTWGRYTRELWDDLYDSEGCLGQSIWSGIDDTFYLKDDQTVGYGTWGPIDGWRRPKPEYWGMKKAYSPVRILKAGCMTVSNSVIEIEVQNRQNFANMNEMKVAWKVGKQSGKTTASLAPRAKGTLHIGLKTAPKAGDSLELTFADPRGFVADQFCLPLASAESRPEAASDAGRPPCTMAESSSDITAVCGNMKWKVSKTSGQLVSVDAGSGSLLLSGPQLMLLPLNSTGEAQMTGKTKVWTPFTEPCAGWVCTKVGGTTDDGKVKVTVYGKYEGAEGSYTLIFHPGGSIAVAYAFTVKKELNPRQVGLVFSLPRECEIFSWEREGYWNVYPEDHIARLKGTVRASEGFKATSVGPRTNPSHPWRLDNLPYGNNDFCSTKHTILKASLVNAGGLGVDVDGQARQHVRCWRTGAAVNLLVADYSNGGSEGYLRGLASKDDRPLKVGDKVTGVVKLAPRVKK